MNSQDYRNLQEAYLNVYHLNELDGGFLGVKRTFGGAPGTKQNTTVSGSASKGNVNVSGSLEKGTFSGQGDKISQGVDNALKNYDNQVKNGKPNPTPRDTSTSTITKGVRGTLNANVSGTIGSNNPQAAQVRDAKKAEMLKTAASNIKNQQLLRQKKQNDGRPDGGRPDGGETPNEKKPENTTTARSRLSFAGITPGDATSREYLQNKGQTPDGDRARSLEKDLNDVEREDNKALIARSVNPRRMEPIPGTNRYGVGSLINQSFDFFDTVRDYLLDEGYADTNENALVIMANMSEEWKKVILDEAVYGGTPKKPKDTRLVVTNADKRANTKAYQNFKAGVKGYKAADHMDEETNELDERVLGQDPEMRRARTKDEKRLPPSSGKGYADNQKKSISFMDKLTKKNKNVVGLVAKEEVEEFDEATAMAKRGHDETAIRNKIASATGGGKTADKATALADRKTYGQKGKGAPDPAAREKLARTQRGDFRKTTSSSPGLHGYGHKSDDPKVKAKQAARGAQRSALTPNERKQLNMSYDLYDTTLEYLITEGYADTNENALVIMANMSEEWRQSIVEGK